MSIVVMGDSVTFHLSTSLEDGTSLDEPGQKDTFTVVAGSPAKEAFRAAISKSLIGMKLQQVKYLKIPPELAFGEPDSNKIVTITVGNPRDYLEGGGIEVKVTRGQEEEITTGTVMKIKGNKVTVDTNHPLAGKTIVATIRILNARNQNSAKL